MLAADAAFAHVLAERTAVVARVPAYRPGEFYLRELPPLRAALDDLSGLGLLVVDAYADLDPRLADIAKVSLTTARTRPGWQVFGPT